MPPAPPDFERVIEIMSSAEADFVIIGGLAMIVHGSDYVTSDIDFAYRRTRENTKRIATALAQLNPRPEGWDASLPFIWDEATLRNSSVLTLATDAGSVDLLGEIAGIDSFDALANGADVISLFGHHVKVASLDDLIRMKQAADRPKDQLHLLELRALKGKHP